MEFKSGAGSQDADAFEVIEIDFQTLCRLCGNVNDQLISIFEDEGAENDLSDKLLEYLPMKITQSDELPKKMCIQCTNSILVWHDFVCACIEADKKLTNMIAISDIYQQQNQKEATEKSQNPKSKLAHIDILKTTDPSNLQEIRKIQYLVDNEDNGQFEALNDMEEDSQDFIKIKETYPESEIDDEKPQCSKAQQISKPTNDTVDQGFHCLTTEPLKFRCSSNSTPPPDAPIPEKNSPTIGLNDIFYVESTDLAEANTLQVQVVEYQNLIIDDVPIIPKAVVKRPRKSKKTKRESKTDETTIVVDGKTYYQCNVCDKKLTTRSIFKQHCLVHSREKNLECKICNKKFRLPSTLHRHIKEFHEQLRKFHCSTCDARFVNKRSLTEHQFIHTGVKTYVCDQCGKAFKQKAALFMHKKSHETVFKFACSECDLKFHTQTSMQVHSSIHTGEKKFGCDTCGRRFRVEYYLKKHMLVHQGPMGFACLDCDKKFRQKRYVSQHYKTCHPSLMYKLASAKGIDAVAVRLDVAGDQRDEVNDFK